MLLSSLGSIWLTVWEQTWFEDFQDGHCGDHLGYRNGTILTILNLYNASHQVSAQWTNGLGGESDVIWKFSKWPTWRPLWYRNGIILTILNLHVAPMPPTKFGLNLTGFRSRFGFRIFKAAWPSWKAERNHFSNSEPLCCSDASYQVSAQSYLRFGRRYHLKNFKMVPMVGILEIGMEQF